jgi:hypothetical protein
VPYVVDANIDVPSTIKAGDVLGSIMNAIRLESQPFRRVP